VIGSLLTWFSVAIVGCLAVRCASAAHGAWLRRLRGLPGLHRLRRLRELHRLRGVVGVPATSTSTRRPGSPPDRLSGRSG